MIDAGSTIYIVHCICREVVCKIAQNKELRDKVEIGGLEITLQRIQNIEQQFQKLTGETAAPSKEFQSILDASMRAPDGEDVSKGEIIGLIEEYSQKNGLDSDFVKAVVKQESGFNEKATSHCGAAGLMQLMPGTAKGLGVTNPYDAEDNVKGGTKMLANLLKTYGGNKELALAAYNAGGGAVKKYGGIPPYQETQNYVKNVLSIYNRYKGGA